MLLKDKVSESLAFLSPRIAANPRIAIVLGSGMGRIAETIEKPCVILTKDIPHYPVSTVPGHSGRWIVGSLGNVPLLYIQGRVHYYEGYSLESVTYYVHLLAGLRIPFLILTTASGGLNPNFKPGDLMLITDAINFTFQNPLVGKPNDLLGPRFPDMSTPFDPRLIAIAEAVGQKLEQPFRKGVFCWVTGPNYETAAEVRALRLIGGDAVSMSTVPEVIVARQRHLLVLGISLITNLATGLAKTELSHAEVTQTAELAGKRLQGLLFEIIAQIAMLQH